MLDRAADIDRHVRGASHGPDFGMLLDGGAELLWHDEGGYAVAQGGRPRLLAARNASTATDLLYAALVRAPSDRDVEVGWLTANQRWAVDASLRAGLELNPAGPVMIRGRRDPPSPYLANGAYG